VLVILLILGRGQEKDGNPGWAKAKGSSGKFRRHWKTQHWSTGVPESIKGCWRKENDTVPCASAGRHRLWLWTRGEFERHNDM